MRKKLLNKYLLSYIIIITQLPKFEPKFISYTNSTNLKHKNLWEYDIFFVNQNNKYKFKFFRFYQFYNLSYLQNIYKIKLKEKNINTIKALPKKLTKILLYKVKNISFKQFGIKYFNEIAHLFLVNIWLKNLKNICRYIKKKLDSVHFKKHRAYFLFFFKILNKYIKPNFQQLQIKGIYLVFKGKLGKGGNSRKKVMFFKRGYYSLSNKLLSLNTHKWDIWTKTGTVGCTMRLFYKNYDNLFKFIYNILFDYSN